MNGAEFSANVEKAYLLPKSDRTEYSDLLTEAGSRGRFQVLLLIFGMMAGCGSQAHILLTQFYFEKPSNFDCIDRNQSSFNESHTNEARCNENCHTWNHTRTTMSPSPLTEWRLYCMSDLESTLIQAAFFACRGVGLLAVSGMADVLGRRKVCIVSATMMLASGVGIAFTDSLATFLVVRSALALFVLNARITAIVLVSELVEPGWRVWIVVAEMLYADLVRITVGAALMIFSDWRIVQIACSLVDLPYLVFVWCFVPESARWLATTGRSEKSLRVLRQVARRNGRKLPDDAKLSMESEAKKSKGGYRDLFRTPTMALKTTEMCVQYFFMAILYYTTAMNVDRFVSGENGQATVLILMGLFSIVTTDVALFFIVRYTSRKYSYSGLMLLTSLATGGAIILPGVWKTACGMVASATINAAYQVTSIRMSEIFPTRCRGSGFALLSVVASISSLTFPFVDYAGTESRLPELVYTAIGLIGAVTSLHLPNTDSATELCETVEQADRVKCRWRW